MNSSLDFPDSLAVLPAALRVPDDIPDETVGRAPRGRPGNAASQGHDPAVRGFTADLFADLPVETNATASPSVALSLKQPAPRLLALPDQRLGDQATVLRGMALPYISALLSELAPVVETAPFRTMITPGGLSMSVSTTNCGALGWISDRRGGYRYTEHDPLTGAPWPALPRVLWTLAAEAAAAAGFPDFDADACLINRYLPGTKMSLHQDRDERDFNQPIVSISLGMPAVFQFGGMQRRDPVQRAPLDHGDVVVWGGRDRLRFHGVLPVKGTPHPLLGAQRLNLTLRRAG